jgi:acetolactate synthase I/II/III large subunit
MEKEMRLANYIMDFFKSKGIKDIFLVYGAANGDLVDACAETPHLRYIQPHHEQAAGFAAEAYARTTRNFGVVIATSGPGGHNLVTPIANCFYESIPCFFITGQINSKFIRKSPDVRQNGFQETDIVDIVKGITKYVKQITDFQKIKYELEKAYYYMMEGRPGPVLLDIPLNIQKVEITPEDLEGYPPPLKQYANPTITLDSLIEDLQNVKRPGILVGGGIRIAHAEEEIRELAKTLNIPVYPTWNALDVITSDFPQYGGRVGTYGGDGRNFGIQNSDLLICIGTRVSGRITGGNPNSFARDAKKYLIDIDSALSIPENHDVKFDHVLTMDAKDFINHLLGRVTFRKFDFSNWLAQVVKWRDKYDPVKPEFYTQEGYVHPYIFARILSEECSKSDIIVSDCGGNVVIMNHSFKTKYGQLYFSNNSNSPMGFSFAASLGAYTGAKGRNVICVIGDGGMNMNIQELQTLKTYNLNPKVFIINNHIYGITKAYQMTNFKGRFEACGPVGYMPPDFIEVAKAYKIKTHRINTNSVYEIREVIKQVLEINEAVVCDINCHEFHTYQPRIFGWNTPIEDMYPYLNRDEFLNNLHIPPYDNYLNPEVPNVP